MNNKDYNQTEEKHNFVLVGKTLAPKGLEDLEKRWQEIQKRLGNGYRL